MGNFTPTLADLATPDLIQITRKKLGLTQQQCANLISVTGNNWAKYEASSANKGAIVMPARAKELFLLKITQNTICSQSV